MYEKNKKNKCKSCHIFEYYLKKLTNNRKMFLAVSNRIWTIKLVFNIILKINNLPTHL